MAQVLSNPPPSGDVMNPTWDATVDAQTAEIVNVKQEPVDDDDVEGDEDPVSQTTELGVFEYIEESVHIKAEADNMAPIVNPDTSTLGVLPSYSDARNMYWSRPSAESAMNGFGTDWQTVVKMEPADDGENSLACMVSDMEESRTQDRAQELSCGEPTAADGGSVEQCKRWTVQQRHCLPDLASSQPAGHDKIRHTRRRRMKRVARRADTVRNEFSIGVQIKSEKEVDGAPVGRASDVCVEDANMYGQSFLTEEILSEKQPATEGSSSEDWDTSAASDTVSSTPVDVSDVNEKHNTSGKIDALNPGDSTTNKVHTCVYCPRVYRGRSSMRRHILRAHPGKSVPEPVKECRIYNCKYCGLEFRQLLRFKEHMNLHERDVSSDLNSDEASVKTTHQCMYCPNFYMTRCSLGKHVHQKHPGKPFPRLIRLYNCDYCGARFKGRPMYENHVKYHEKFEDAKLVDIMRQHQLQGPEAMLVQRWPCPDCPKLCSSEQHLKMHLKAHANSGTDINLCRCVCQICGVSSYSALDLANHVRAQHAPKNPRLFECSVCSKAYSTRQQMTRHARCHTKPFWKRKKEKEVRKSRGHEDCDLCCTFLQKLNTDRKKNGFKEGPSESAEIAADESSKPPERRPDMEARPVERSSECEVHSIEQRDESVVHPVEQRPESEAHPVEQSPETKMHPIDQRPESEAHLVEQRPENEAHPVEQNLTEPARQSLLPEFDSLADEAGECKYCGIAVLALLRPDEHLKVHRQNNDRTLAELYQHLQQDNQPLNLTLASRKAERPYHCKLCPGTFPHPSKLVHHMRTHQNNFYPKLTPHACKVCQDTFSTRSALRLHIEQAHNLEAYRCPHCSKNCINFYYWRKHVNHFHHQANQRALEEQERLGKQLEEGALKQCRYCSKRFFHNNDLKKHELIHTAQKPFSCEICGKNFRQRGHVKCHLLTHTGEKPHTCQYCNKKFAHTSSRNKHYKEVHYDKLVLEAHLN